jgi:subtilisin family serine protease
MVDAALLARAERDQRVREAAPSRGSWPEDVVAACRAIDADNTSTAVQLHRHWSGRARIHRHRVRATHSQFTRRIGNWYDFVDNDADPSDCAGHGTHVAGTAQLVEHVVAALNTSS